MDFQPFHDIILLQFLGKAMDFSEDNMKLLKERCYSRPTAASAYLFKIKKYLGEMEKRSTQKIPFELLQEMFPGNHLKDVYLSGIILESFSQPP